MSDKTALEKMRTTPVLEIPMLNKLKRKYPDSAEVSSLQAPQQPKKSRTDLEPVLHSSVADAPHGELSFEGLSTSTPRNDSIIDGISPSDDRSQSLQQPVHHSPQSAEPHPDQVVPTTSMESSFLPDLTGTLSPVQQVIENEFNMQILFKHNELRLIEQELAKCQVALEQLRRCELRPYPGMDQPSAAVSAGVGPAITPPSGLSRPSHPAPHGVTDGPYSRHYRRWLLQDPQFDPMSPQIVAQMETPINASGRPTRNSGTVRKFSTKAVCSTTRTSDPLQSLPNYPSVPAKDKSAPLVLRRSTDGLLVKLICNNCHRGNFSSIQGFLNHCRIAHKVDYKSHDLAAIDCGRALDENELANLPAETHASAPKPTVTRASTTVTQHTPSSRNLVHPLNTNVGATSSLMTPVSATSTTMTPAPSLGSPAPQNFSSLPFKASNQVPRLSAYFAKHQLGGDLEQAAFRAKQRSDFSADDELLSPQTPDTTSPVLPMVGSRTVAGGAHASAAMLGSDSARPPSRKGYRQPAVQRPRPSPLAPSEPFAQSDLLQAAQDTASAASLSPHAADSNPGLVSDHEDDDHGSASEEEAPHNEIPHPPFQAVTRECGDHMEIDVASDEELGQHGVIIRRNSMLSADARALRTAGSPSRKLGMGKGGK